MTDAVKAGEPLPAPEPVEPADLRRYWEFMQKMRAQHPAAAGCVGIDIRLVAAELPGVFTVPVYLRACVLQILEALGALREWQHQTAMDDVVFQVAAIFPFGGNHIQTELFREHLRAASGRD